MANGMDPGRMTPTERLDEVGMLLSLALMRQWLKGRPACGRQRAFSRDFQRDCLESAAGTGPDGTVERGKE